MAFDKIAEHVSAVIGERFEILKQSPIGGGSINRAYLIENKRQRFFLKTNSPSLADMFNAEADGLKELQSSGSVRVPRVICFGKDTHRSYLVLEYIDIGHINSASPRRLGEQLASMHAYHGQAYGWHRNNTIGSTPQINTQESLWPRFYRDHRLAYQLDLAAKNGARRNFIQTCERLLADIEVFFASYNAKPSLLHGDLWSGNVDFDEQGEPVLFDPAVYYGDRESDIAMTELFGGFSPDFYHAYRNVTPLDEGYKTRRPLYNLYHVLNHFNLFGGGYLQQAHDMADRLLAEIK